MTMWLLVVQVGTLYCRGGGGVPREDSSGSYTQWEHIHCFSAMVLS